MTLDCWTGPYYTRTSDLVDASMAIVVGGYTKLFDQDSDIAQELMRFNSRGKPVYPKIIRNLFKVDEYISRYCDPWYQFDHDKFCRMRENRNQLPIAKAILALNKYDDRHKHFATLTVSDALEAVDAPGCLAYPLVKELEKFVAEHDKKV